MPLPEDCRECERRILTLETTIKVLEQDVALLKTTSHEKSNWLNRHNLELNTLMLQINDNKKAIEELSLGHNSMHDKYHSLELKLINELNSFKIMLDSKMAILKSDQRITMLLVSILTAIVVFASKAIFGKWLG